MLTFHGHDKLKTKFGAICTIILGLIVLSYAAFKATELFNLKHALPVRSTIFNESLYEIYGGDIDNIKSRDGSLIELGEFSDPIHPQSFFAFGLGDEDLVSADVGYFSAKVYHKEDVTHLSVIPCSQSTQVGIEDLAE